MAAVTHESHALPVLIATRSPSPFLLEGEGRLEKRWDSSSISSALARKHLPTMVAASHENHALPVLIAARSPSPFLLEGKSRGRSPNARPLPHSRQLPSPPLLLPAPVSNVQKDVTVQSHSVSTVIIGTPSAPARDESSFAKDVQAEPDVQEHHALTQAETGCQLPMELPASGSYSIGQNHCNKLRKV